MVGKKSEAKPDVVIKAAAKVVGIVAPDTYPIEFLQDNVRIQTDVFEPANQCDVPQLLFLGNLKCLRDNFDL